MNAAILGELLLRRVRTTNSAASGSRGASVSGEGPEPE